MPLKARLAFVFSVFFVSGFVGLHLHAQTMSSQSYWSPHSWMRAGASVAWTDELDAMSSNPGLLFRAKGRTTFGGSWARLPRDLGQWSVGVADGRTAVVGGIRYDWADENKPRRQGVHLSAAYPTQYGTVGVTADGYHFSDLQKYNGWHFSNSIGAYVPLGQGFAIAAMGKNLIDRARDSILPPEFATGMTYSYKESIIFQFQADRRFSIPGQNFSYSFGLDMITRKFFSIKGGYRWDHENERKLWSVGGAIEAPRSFFSGFYTRTIDGPSSQGFGFKANFSF